MNPNCPASEPCLCWKRRSCVMEAHGLRRLPWTWCRGVPRIGSWMLMWTSINKFHKNVQMLMAGFVRNHHSMYDRRRMDCGLKAHLLQAGKWWILATAFADTILHHSTDLPCSRNISSVVYVANSEHRKTLIPEALQPTTPLSSSVQKFGGGRRSSFYVLPSPSFPTMVLVNCYTERQFIPSPTKSFADICRQKPTPKQIIY